MSSDYSWANHIAKIADDGRKMLSWILSVFRDRSKTTMLTLYSSMVRSKMEYCCPLWNPSSVTSIQKLEEIQRTFTSKINGCKEMQYWDRLKWLNLLSLQRRRERYMIIHTWKILHNLTNNDIGMTFKDTENVTRRGITANVPSLPRGISAKVISIYDNSYAIKAPQLWNCLPKYVKAANSMESFKSLLGQFMDTIPDMPPVLGSTGVNNNAMLDWAQQAQITEAVLQ